MNTDLRTMCPVCGEPSDVYQPTDDSHALTAKILKRIVVVLRQCAAEHFYRYDLNTLASKLEDIVDQERERTGPWR